MRKAVFLVLTLLLLAGACPCARAEDELSVSARCAVLMGPEGQILFARNADERCLIASTTKLMTALVALEHADPDETAEIPAECCGIEGSSMYLRPGERYTLRDLLTGLLLVSGNDAAEALALHCAGSEAGFVDWMNQKAGELGMTNTHFANPHGLDAEGHYGSAADLARLMAACMRQPELERILGLSSAEIAGQSYYNHNKLLWRCSGCLGGKTGYTRAAGRCLVSCCEREGTRLYCVTLSAPDDWDDHMTLYDWGYARYATRNLTEDLRLTVPVIAGTREETPLEAEALWAFLPRDAEPSLRVELPPFVFAPLRAGERAGTVSAVWKGEVLGSAALRCAETVESVYFGRTT